MICSDVELNLFIDVYIANQRQVTTRWWNSNNINLQNIFMNLFYWIVAPGSLKLDTQIEIISKVCEELSLKQILTPNDPLKQKKVNTNL